MVSAEEPSPVEPAPAPAPAKTEEIERLEDILSSTLLGLEGNHK